MPPSTVTALSCCAVALVWISCSGPSLDQYGRPDHFPPVTYPSDNLLTRERIALGEKMFFDPNLSLDSTISCATCHLAEAALADHHVISPGIEGRRGHRNTPSIFNVAYLQEVNKDGGVKNLDLQALVPIEDEEEMGISILKLTERLQGDREYVRQSRQAYGRDPDGYVVTRALASFVRTLFSGDSPYDRYLQGDSSALSDQQLAGLQLFESPRLNCTGCHSGMLLTDHSYQNNGLYTDYEDIGRALITQDTSDIGKFRVPSLRNVVVTYPYMHDGSLSGLDDVLDHYQRVGRMPTKRQSALIQPFELATDERAALLAFLHALTDSSLLEGTR